MQINELVQRAHDTAVEHGFWRVQQTTAGRLMLIVTELAEACEADRHGDRDNLAEELADVAIRLGDLCGGLGIDLEQAVLDKMAINEGRPVLHGKQY